MEIKEMRKLGKLKKSGHGTWIDASMKNHASVFSSLAASGVTHITMISGIDTGKEMEVIYHFAQGSDVISIRFRLARSKPVPSIRAVYPGAEIYELELREMLGIEVEGLPEGRLFLADGSPKAPLRRDSHD